jgi:purine-nucleoside phosphorylase
MATPHIDAEPGDFAEDVLMPGDPLRAERIAEAILEDAKRVAGVRGMLGYTGTYRGQRLSVMASGMGMPSITIYATELARSFGVRRLVRVGTAGSMAPQVRLGDVVIALGAHTDSAMTAARVPGLWFSHVPAVSLLRRAIALTDDWDAPVALHTGTVFSTDSFYLKRPEFSAALREHGAIAVDMEAAALYAVGAAEGVQALTVLTVSDNSQAGEAMTARERETGFGEALRVALAALELS